MEIINNFKTGFWGSHSVTNTGTFLLQLGRRRKVALFLKNLPFNYKRETEKITWQVF